MGCRPPDHGRRDLLLVATETNWVYAFDLDDTSGDPATAPVAKRQLQPSGRVVPAICGETPSQRVGITSTPVVDAATRTLYAVARNAADHQYYLHALDLTADLADRRPPVRIAPVDPQRREVRFNADCQRNRPALLLLEAASSTSPSAAWPATATVRTEGSTAAGSPATAPMISPRWPSSRPAPIAATPGSGKRAAARWASAIASTS